MRTDQSKSAEVVVGRLPSGTAPHRSGGVTLGFVDYGFDILHPALLRPAGGGGQAPRSHFAALFDQNTGVVLVRRQPIDDPHSTMPAPHHGVLDQLIEHALRSGERSAADRLYDPHLHYYDATDGRFGAHGTMMASIALAAAAAEVGTAGAGLAVDLAAVQLALPEAGWREIDGAGEPTWAAWESASEPVWGGWRSYLDQSAIVDAIAWLHDAACRGGDDGLVVNLSLGTWAGAHDGCSRVERKIAEVLARSEAGDGPVTAIVVPMGNAGCDRGHAAGTVGPAAPWSVAWTCTDPASTLEKLEVWYHATSPVAIEIDFGGGRPAIDIAPGPTTDLRVDGHRIGIADHRVAASGKLSAIRLSISPARWRSDTRRVRITLTAQDDAAPASVHAWVERRGDGIARSSLDPHDLASTLAGIATAPGAIVVGALDTTGDGAARPYAVSGQGPHPWRSGADARLPHVWAPGHRIRAARSKRADTTVTSGTSAACATVAGRLSARFATARAAALRDGCAVRPALVNALAEATHTMGADVSRHDRAATAFRFLSSQPMETRRP